MDFNFRQYDPQLGRFNSVDPLAGSTDMVSPYAAMGNAPEGQIDPNGTSNFLFHFGGDGGLTPNPIAPGSWLSDPNKEGSMGKVGGWNLDNSPSGMGEGDQSPCGGGSSDQSGYISEDQINAFLATVGGSNVMVSGNGSISYFTTNFGGAAPGGQDGCTPDDFYGSGGNESTQNRVLFFKSERKAYKYMLDNSIEDIESGGEPTRPIENFAYVTKEGVYVLPTSGEDINGKSYRNYANEAEWRIFNYKVSDQGMTIENNGKWQTVLAAVHTHPQTPMGIASHSSADRGWIDDKKTLGIVLGYNGQAYGMIPGSTGAINFASNADLLSGRISIIAQYAALMQYFRSNK